MNARKRTATKRVNERRVLAIRKTWQPNGRIERVIKRKYIPFHTPAQLVRDAHVALVPEWCMSDICLMLNDNRAEPALLNLRYGSDDNGESTEVVIELRADDAKRVLMYLTARGMVRHAMVFSNPPNDPDDDGGEELDLPTITEAELAAMQPTTEAVQ